MIKLCILQQTDQLEDPDIAYRRSKFYFENTRSRDTLLHAPKYNKNVFE